MGNGRLLQGVGYGDATVFNPNDAIQQFGNILAQQKAEKQARDQALVNQMTSLKSDAIRDADKEDYLAKYNDWKQAAINANNIPKNSKERLDAIANAQAKYNSLGEFIGGSKEQKLHENSLGNMWLSNGHLFDDASHQKFIKSMQSPMSSSDFIPHTKYGDFERYIDPQKMNNLLDTGKKKSLDDVIPERMEEKNYVSGDKRGVLVRNVKSVPYEKVAENYLHLAAINPDFKKYLHDTYKDIQGSNELETTAARIHQLAVDRGETNGWQHADVAQFKPNDDSFAKHVRNRIYDINHPITPTDITPTQKLITDMQKGVPGSGEKMLSLIPQGQYGKAKPAIAIDATNGDHLFNFPAVVDIDGLIKAPAKTYKINPASPDYLARVAEMAREQKINLPLLDKSESVKGGRGQIDAAKTPTTQTTKPKQVSSDAEFKALKPGEMFITPDGKVLRKK